MKPHYADYVKRAMRYHLAHPRPGEDKPLADRENWAACEYAMGQFDPEVARTLAGIYQSREGFPRAVERVAKERNLPPNQVWSLVNILEKTVARRRGLI